jgi:hypothetical protein
MDMRFGTWNVRSMYRASSLRVVRKDISEYKYMGGACSTNGGEDECLQDIGGKARRKETTGKTKT